MKSRKHLPILGVPCALSLLKNLGCFKLQVRWISQLRIFKKYWKHRNETKPTQGWGLGISFDSFFWGGGGKFTFLEQSFELYDFRFKNLLEGPRSPQIPETTMYILWKLTSYPSYSDPRNCEVSASQAIVIIHTKILTFYSIHSLN